MKLETGNGVRIEGVPYVLDANRPVRRAWCSHAHADHCARHGHIVGTPETLHFARLRWGKMPSTELPFGRKLTIGDITYTAYRSGHILGGAMLLIEIDGLRLLHTGDANAPDNCALTAPADPVPVCDVLICEATFGDPCYVWPSRQELCERLIQIVQETLDSGQTPVVIAYSLGKAQEVVRILGDAGIGTRCDAWIMKYNEAYRHLGVDLTGDAPLTGNPQLTGEVAVVSPPVRRSMLDRIIRPRTIQLTGWSMTGGLGPSRFAADVMLPLSDHADFPGLLRLVEASRAKHIVTIHGAQTFADELRKRGHDALHLSDKEPVFFDGRGLSRRQGEMFGL